MTVRRHRRVERLTISFVEEQVEEVERDHGPEPENRWKAIARHTRRAVQGPLRWLAKTFFYLLLVRLAGWAPNAWH
jgi:hypothetical protein